MKQNTKKFYNIQSLRGVAALLVVIYHTLPHYKAMETPNLVIDTIGRFGYIGVDMFFVISGFVMARTSLNKAPSISSSVNFLTKRFLRIFLGFWPIFGLALLYYYQFENNYLDSKNITQSFLLLSTNISSLVIGQAWSLTYELYFYLIVATLLVSNTLKPKPIFLMLIVFVVIKNILYGIGSHTYLDFFLSSLLLEFIGGYFLYYCLEKLSSRKFLSLTVFFAGLSLVFGVYFNVSYGYMRVLTFGVFAISLVWLFLLLEINKIIICSGILKRVGDASYTLYLCHTIFLDMFFTSGLRNHLANTNYSLFGIFIYVILIVVFSMLFYKFIELPLYKYAKRKMLK